MPPTMPHPDPATEGNKTAERFQPAARVESGGKAVALGCLLAAIEAFCAARRLSRAQLAEDLCGMSESNFSKVANGVQGDFWALVYKLPGDIREDFFERLHATEHGNPLGLALEQLHAAMWRVINLTGGALVTTAMAKATLAERKRRRA